MKVLEVPSKLSAPFGSRNLRVNTDCLLWYLKTVFTFRLCVNFQGEF